MGNPGTCYVNHDVLELTEICLTSTGVKGIYHRVWRKYKSFVLSKSTFWIMYVCQSLIRLLVVKAYL